MHENPRLYRLRGEVIPDRECEHVDHFPSVRPQQVRPKDPAGLILDQHFERRVPLVGASRRVPACGVLLLHRELNDHHQRWWI